MRLRIFSLVSLGLYLLTALILFTDRPSSRVSVPVGAANPQILASYGKLPLSFEVNRGQTDEEVEFLSRGKGYTLFLTSTDAVLSLRKGSAEPEAQVPRLVNDRGGTGVSPVAGTPLPNRNVLAERPAGKAWAELRPESSAHILKAKGTNLPEGLSPAEWSDIQKQIRDSEYELAPAEPGTPGVPRTGWQALNWAQDLRAYFNEERIQVVPRREPEPSWEWGLTLKSYGYQGRTRPVRTAERVAGGNRIEYRRGDLTEWYVNEERGLEQGFTLAAPPGARGEDFLSIELDLSGTLVPKLTEDGTAILFEDRRGRTILRYSGLLAWDAGGRELPARMAVERGEVSIRVDDRGAVYPVTIDPIVTQEAKLTASDAAVGEEFGFSVAVAGDTVVVGADLRRR